MASKLNNFHDAVQSLKLYRRAELPGQDNNSAIVEKLYVDPLPSDHVFETIRMPNTSFIIGRKGTGKSTIFQRLQYELIKDKKKTSAYIDIKTIFESSQVDGRIHAKIASMESALPEQEIERILLLKAFVVSVIVEIKKELKRRTENSFWETVKDSFSGNLDELFEELDELIEEIDVEKFISVLGVRYVQGKQNEESNCSRSLKLGAKLKIDPNPLELSADIQKNSEHKDSREINYSDILISVFDIKDLLSKLKSILSSLGVRHLYILIDDFSELPEDAMKVVVDLLLAPLNNWSEEFIKLKVAAYPGRIYYGQIDKTKIDEVYLDIYKLYGSHDVSTMEDNATEFVRRLVVMRIKVYKAGKVQDYFDSNFDEILKELGGCRS